MSVPGKAYSRAFFRALEPSGTANRRRSCEARSPRDFRLVSRSAHTSAPLSGAGADTEAQDVLVALGVDAQCDCRHKVFAQDYRVKHQHQKFGRSLCCICSTNSAALRCHSRDRLLRFSPASSLGRSWATLRVDTPHNTARIIASSHSAGSRANCHVYNGTSSLPPSFDRRTRGRLSD